MLKQLTACKQSTDACIWLTQVGGSIGFVADERRINVGLTRARSSLIVIGNARALQRDARWGNLVRHASLLK